MKSPAQIAQTLEKAVRDSNAAIGVTNGRLAKIGNGEGVPRPDRLLHPLEVYYRADLDNNDRGIALLITPKIPIQAIDGYYDVAVWIGNVPGSVYPVIYDIADITGQTTGQQTPLEGLINAAAFPDITRLVEFRLSPSVGGGISVFVDVGWTAVAYQDSTGTTQFFRSQDFGFADPTNADIFIPVAAVLAPTEHRLIGIAFDPANSTMRAIPGVAVSTAETLPSAASRSVFGDTDFSAIDFTDLYPCGYVYSYYNQTAVIEDDCMRHYDPRVSMSRSGSGGGSIDRIETDENGDVVSDEDGNVVVTE